MSELAEVAAFLAAHAPFTSLSAGQLARLSRSAEAVYARRGQEIVRAGAGVPTMFVVRSGAVEVRSATGALMTHHEEGSSFGQASILEGRSARFTFTAYEDTLLWRFDHETVAFLDSIGPVHTYFTQSRLTEAMRPESELGRSVLQTSVADMVAGDPVSISSGATIRDAARLMEDRRVSAVLVTRDERLVGILTDRDLRRTVARSIPGDTQLREVMSLSPTTISSDGTALDVLLTLITRRIHHLPVVDDGSLTGMVTAGDLMRLERSSPLYIVGDLARRDDLQGLSEVMSKVPHLVTALLRQEATAADISAIISRTTDALWRRLAVLAEQRFGPPPVPYCWIALGSLARNEQALGSDQDHAFVLSDDASPEHDAYFARLAEFLSDALVACGYPRCRGDVMPTNPAWRRPIGQWRQVFSQWLAAPTAEAVLRSSIFFDLRPVHGEEELATQLHQRVLAAAPHSPRFLGHLASHAGDIDVPLGFLRGLVVEKHGSHHDRLDIKHGGITPIVDVARLYALRWSLPMVGTRERLRAAAVHGAATANLLDAHEYLSYARLRHQGRQIMAGEQPDNHLAPGQLTDFEQRTLRDAFWYVSQAQRGLAVTFQTQFMS